MGIFEEIYFTPPPPQPLFSFTCGQVSSLPNQTNKLKRKDTIKKKQNQNTPPTTTKKKNQTPNTNKKTTLPVALGMCQELPHQLHSGKCFFFVFSVLFEKDSISHVYFFSLIYYSLKFSAIDTTTVQNYTKVILTMYKLFFLSCYRNYNLFLYLLYTLYSVNILREYLQYLACQIRNAIT